MASVDCIKAEEDARTIIDVVLQEVANVLGHNIVRFNKGVEVIDLVHWQGEHETAMALCKEGEQRVFLPRQHLNIDVAGQCHFGDCTG